MRKIDRLIDCPWCGNDMMVQGALSNQPKEQKCKWCRRWSTIQTKFKGNKVTFEAESKDFPEPARESAKEYKDRYAMIRSGLEYGR